MKICLPVDQLNGLSSEIFPNFKGAPALLIVDSDSRECLGIDASSGACGSMPITIDAVVQSGGLGRGLFNGLKMRGIRVYHSDAITVEEALGELLAGSLEELQGVECCGGGHHDHAQGEGAHGGCGCGGGGHQHGHEGGGCGCGGHDHGHAHGHHHGGGCGCGGRH